MSDFSLPIVGESHYQDAFEAICGKRKKEGEDKIVEAVLILEDSNPHDKNAVRVEIDGKTVGHLDREHAKAYRLKLAKSGQPNAKVSCPANIRGGWQRGSKRGHYGVWLDFSIEEELRVAQLARASDAKTSKKSPAFAWIVGILVIICATCYLVRGSGNQVSQTRQESAQAETPATPASAPALPTPANEAQKIPKAPTYTPAFSTPFIEVRNNINFYGGPGREYSVMGQLSAGQSFEITGRNADSSWWQIATDDGPAWVTASVVNARNIDQAIKVIDAPTPVPTSTQAPFSPAPPAAGGGGTCCRVCSSGKACGDSCIAADKVCTKPPGCACGG